MKRSDIVDVDLKDTLIILSDNIIQKLNAKPGDRIAIGYFEKEGVLTPMISIGEEGNKLTKSNTVSFRGHQRNVLAQFGTQFWVNETDGILELQGDGIPVYTSVKKAAETYITKDIIEDRNYTINYIKDYEF